MLYLRTFSYPIALPLKFCICKSAMHPRDRPKPANSFDHFHRRRRYVASQSGRSDCNSQAGLHRPLERNQPGGDTSGQRLQQLLPRGQAIQIRQVDTDRYGRTVGELYLNGRSDRSTFSSFKKGWQLFTHNT